MKKSHVRLISSIIPMVLAAGAARAQNASPASGGATRPTAPSVSTASPSVTPEYVIGAEDVLSIMFWRDKDISAEVAVRPDGVISLPLLNDVQAAGLTPLQLRDELNDRARRFVDDPNVTVVVRQINSRKVFVTGEVGRPGPYPLTAPTTVLQILATAGGLREYADAENIVIMRVENGRPVSFRFNYRDMAKRKNLRQNIELKPGDTIIVP